jgi:hypothetical protein
VSFNYDLAFIEKHLHLEVIPILIYRLDTCADVEKTILIIFIGSLLVLFSVLENQFEVLGEDTLENIFINS